MFRVLIVHTWGIGDWLFFTPVLKALKASHPRSEIEVILGTPATRHIIELYSEVRIRAVADVRRSPLSMIVPALRTWPIKYDLLLFTAGINSQKADKLAALIRAVDKAVLRTGSEMPRFINLSGEFSESIHLVENNLNLARVAKLAIADDAIPYLPSAQGQPPPVPGSILIHPGSDRANAYRRWPVERFYAVASALLAQKRPVSVVLGYAESELASAFSSLAGTPGFHLYRNLPYAELFRLVQAHETLLNSDSGLGHIAAALGRRTIAIFGPADPSKSRPYSPRSVVIKTEKKLDCMPCVKIGGLYGCLPRPCLMDIEVERVLRALAALDALKPA